MSTPDVHAATNGTVPAGSDPLAAIVAELEDLLAPLTAEREQLEARLKDLDTQTLKIKEGIAALSTTPRVTPPRGRPAAAKPDKRNTHDWIPSQKTLDDIYATLARSEEPLAVTAIAETVKTSRGTVSKGIEELRRRELVRFVGNGGRGGANLFAPMEK